MAMSPEFSVRLARTAADVSAVQRLRYEVFVRELGGRGDGVDHAERREQDPFDSHCDHLMLVDGAGGTERVVGAYRLMREAQARAAGRFYCEQEYDLAPLRRSGRALLELGRGCVHPDYRGGAGLFHLWQGLADYVKAHRCEVLFGVASFPGTDPDAHANELAFLAERHLAPPDLRLKSRRPEPLTRLARDRIDRVAAARALPPLLKAYLRLGGFVAGDAFVDEAFNTVDVLLVLDVARMTPRHRALYAGELA